MLRPQPSPSEDPAGVVRSADSGGSSATRPPSLRRERSREPVRGLVVGTELMSEATAVCYAGEIDLATAGRFASTLNMHLNDGAPAVVIDLAEIDFISVEGVRTLLEQVGRARRRGMSVRVVPSPAVLRTVALFRTVAAGHPVPPDSLPPNQPTG